MRMARYSASSGPGVLYRIHSPRAIITACPDRRSNTFCLVSTRSIPRKTTVYSSNSCVCLGSCHPGGLCMRAMLTAITAAEHTVGMADVTLSFPRSLDSTITKVLR